MLRFRGEYEHTVDAKGRVSLPAKFRKIFAELGQDEVVVVPGAGGAIYVFAEEAFEAWVDAFFPENGEGTGYDARNKKDVMLRKQLNRNAENVLIDSAGRIMLSAKKRKAAGIDKDVVIIGDKDHIEIWDAERLDESMGEFLLDDYLND